MFSPNHQPKELEMLTLSTNFRSKKKMSQFRIKEESAQADIKNQKVRIQVYTIEVQNKVSKIEEKWLLNPADDPMSTSIFE